MKPNFLRRIGRTIAAPWRWLLLQQARTERRRRNDLRSIRRVFAALSRQLDDAERIRERLNGTRRPAYRLAGGELAPFPSAIHGDDSEGGSP